MDEHSVLLSWGPPRMGTTWMFNVLRSMLSAAGVAYATVADGVPRPEASWAGPVLIKSHRADAPALVSQFDASVDLLACVMVRDTRRTFQSLVRTQTASRDELIGWLEADLASYQQVLPHMRHVAVCREEWVAPRGAEVLTRLSEFLGLGLDGEACARIAAEFDRDAVKAKITAIEREKDWAGNFGEYDRETQWHAGHIAPDDSPSIEPTPAESERLDRLQAGIDALVERHGLWQAANVGAVEPLPVTSAMTYVQARFQLLDAVARPRPGVFERLRGLLGSKRH